MCCCDDTEREREMPFWKQQQQKPVYIQKICIEPKQRGTVYVDPNEQGTVYMEPKQHDTLCMEPKHHDTLYTNGTKTA